MSFWFRESGFDREVKLQVRLQNLYLGSRQLCGKNWAGMLGPVSLQEIYFFLNYAPHQLQAAERSPTCTGQRCLKDPSVQNEGRARQPCSVLHANTEHLSRCKMAVYPDSQSRRNSSNLAQWRQGKQLSLGQEDAVKISSQTEQPCTQGYGQGSSKQGAGGRA